ncbi:helix-turn-helix transcriptional regulator [Sphingobium yanoikuyae]|uniref:helix-turn-helix transcriptional regulator n=1 Tax=Sphingobium yanoikuyae TaxID=13690 RepID=UPI0035C6F604
MNILDLLTVSDVLAKLHISRTTLYELRKAGDFPRHYCLSPRRIAWPRSTIEDWITQREQEQPQPIF